jgi:hypothetical protein
MSGLGNSRRFRDAPKESGSPLITDLIRPTRHVSKVPNPDMTDGSRKEKAARRRLHFKPDDRGSGRLNLHDRARPASEVPRQPASR